MCLGCGSYQHCIGAIGWIPHRDRRVRRRGTGPGFSVADVVRRLAVFLLGASKIEIVDGVVTVGDDHLRYVATTDKPSREEAVQWYRAFADAMANFNAWTSGGTPPFARLALNAAVADQGRIPAEIQRHIQSGKTALRHTSRLHTTWLLSKADRARITEAQKGLVSYTQVDLGTFQNRVQAARVAKR